MTHTIIKNDDYEVVVTTTPVEALPGQYHLKFESRLNSAKDPKALRTMLAVTCTQWGMEQLGREIYEAIMKDTA